MVGCHTNIYRGERSISLDNLSFLKHEEWFNIDSIIDANGINMSVSHYKGYPYEKWDNASYTVLLEGMIYNYKEREIVELLSNLADQFCKDSDYEKSIAEFVNNADGDYIIQIYDKKNDRLILFDDYLGRLPIYYYLSEKQVLLSREIKYILEFIPEISFNKGGIVENLMLGYSLGEKTIFNNIKRLSPCEYLLCEFSDDIKYSVGKTADFSFKTEDKFKSKEKSLTQLKEHFLEATKNRINKLQEKGYSIISDLSGGYDSRAVIGGLAQFDKKINYYTYEYIQDESIIANKLFCDLNKPGEHIKTSFNNVVDMDNISALVYKTDGLVNYYTTGICYNDSNYIKGISASLVGHFGGFGGEFIRHPQKKFYLSIFKGFKNSLYSYLSPKEACSIINNNYTEYIKEVKTYFQTYQDTTKDANLKQFYYEYYLKHVGAAGEERGRIFQWYLHPLWSKDFVKTIFQQIPLRWTGFSYFIDFMREVDVRLLDAPIFKSDVDLKSVLSIERLDEDYNRQLKKNWLVNFMKDKSPWLLSFYRKFRGKGEVNPAKGDELDVFFKFYDKLDVTKNIFNIAGVESNRFNIGGEYNNVATLAMYLYEIEKRYSHKINMNT